MVVNEAVNWDEMEWEYVRRGVRRKVFHVTGCTIVLNELEPAHEPKPHSHPYEQLVYITRGKMKFTLAEKEFEMRSGSLLAVPPGVVHYAQVIGHEPSCNVDIFVPMRRDYVQSKVKAKV